MSEVHPAEKGAPADEGWAFLSPNGVGAHYFRGGRSFCGRDLPPDTRVRGDVSGVGSDPAECRRCAERAHVEVAALDAAENARMDAEDAPCDGSCLTGYDIGIPGPGIAHPHPDCPAHGDLWKPYNNKWSRDYVARHPERYPPRVIPSVGGQS